MLMLVRKRKQRPAPAPAAGPKRRSAPRGVFGVACRVAAIALYLVALAGLAGTSTLGYLLANNTLSNDGQWLFTKERLELVPAGGPSYMYEPQPLARCHLNLGAWCSYNELLYKSKMPFQRIEFDFRLNVNAYFVVYLLNDLRTFTGIRISDDPQYPSAYLEGTRDGHFDSKRPLDTAQRLANQWCHLVLEADGKALRLSLNGLPVDLGRIPAPKYCRPGFRGGLSHVLIDNFAVNGEVLDTFLVHESWWRVLAVVLVAMFFATTSLAAVLRMVDVPWRKVGWGLLAATVMALVFAVSLTYFVYVHAERYPADGRTRQGELMFCRDKLGGRNAEIAEEAARATRAGSFLVLVCGTSQTYGVGASRKEEAFVSVLQRKVDAAYPRDPGVACVNAGKAASRAKSLFEDYAQEWVKLNPRILVLNLSSNDQSDPDFGSDLQRFVDLNKARGIQTVFVCEANAMEYWPGAEELPLHPVMREIGRQNQVPVIELHEFMKAHHDEGFLWWDYVHGTDFGQRLMAECVFEGLKPLLPKE